MFERDHYCISLTGICIFLLFGNFTCSKTTDTIYNELTDQGWELNVPCVYNNNDGYSIMFSSNSNEVLDENSRVVIGTYEITKKPGSLDLPDEEKYLFSGNYIFVEFHIEIHVSGSNADNILFVGHYQGQVEKTGFSDKKLIKGHFTDTSFYAAYGGCDFSALSQ
jgi:hypothetical protein